MSPELVFGSRVCFNWNILCLCCYSYRKSYDFILSPELVSGSRVCFNWNILCVAIVTGSRMIFILSPELLSVS